MNAYISGKNRLGQINGTEERRFVLGKNEAHMCVSVRSFCRYSKCLDSNNPFSIVDINDKIPEKYKAYLTKQQYWKYAKKYIYIYHLDIFSLRIATTSRLRRKSPTTRTRPRTRRRPLETVTARPAKQDARITVCYDMTTTTIHFIKIVDILHTLAAPRSTFYINSETVAHSFGHANCLNI